MIASVLVSHALREKMLTQAKLALPREACGLLEGSCDGKAVTVTEVHPTRNLSGEPDRFEIDPAEQIRLMRALRGTDRRIVGCYHSHPNGRAEPSPRDAENAGEVDFLWLIAAVTEDGRAELRAFAAVDGGFAPVELV